MMAEHRVRLDEDRWTKVIAIWKADPQAGSPSEAVGRLIDKTVGKRKGEA